MTVNLGLYVSLEDYGALAGPDWPTYEEYINNISAQNPEIQQ